MMVLGDKVRASSTEESKNSPIVLYIAFPGDTKDEGGMYYEF